MSRARYAMYEKEIEKEVREPEIVLTTKKEKFENHWHYFKLFYIVGAIILIVLSVTLIKVLTAKEADYTVAIVSTVTYPSEILEQIKDVLTQYADDRNEDGFVIVAVNQYEYAFTEENADMGSDKYHIYMSGVAKFTEDVSNGKSMVFICDEVDFSAIFKDYNEFFTYKNTWEDPTPDETDKDLFRIKLGECAAFASENFIYDSDDGYRSDITEYVKTNLTISLRTLNTLKGNNEAEAYFNDSAEFVNRIISGEVSESK